MGLINWENCSRQDTFDYFGYVEGKHVLPFEDLRGTFWGTGTTRFSRCHSLC